MQENASDINQNQSQSHNQEQDLDLVWLIRYVVSYWKRIAQITGGVLLLSIVIYFVREKVFTASTTLLPISESTSMSGNMKSLASLAGVNLTSSSSSASITLELYPDVVMSTSTLYKLSNEPISWPDSAELITPYEFYKADTVLNFGRAIMAYTIGLPKTLKKVFGKAEEIMLNSDGDATSGFELIAMDEPRRNCLEWLEKSISVSVDDEVGTVSIGVEGKSPEQSVQLCLALMRELQNTISKIKTSTAHKNVEVLEQRCDELMEDYSKHRSAYYAYKDKHRDYIEERTDVSQQTLEDRYNMTYSVLQNLQSQLEMSRIEALSNTPAFAVVQPVVVPHKKSSPKMLMHLVGGVFLGLFFTIGFLVLRLAFWQMFDRKKFDAIRQSLE